MGQLRTGLRAYALDGHSPGDTLKRLDRMLQTISGRGMATAAYAVVDPATGTLRYASAGHPPPVIVRGGREAHLLELTAAPPLGSLPFSAYPEAQDDARANDTILLYTDGLIERRTRVAHGRPRAPARGGRRRRPAPSSSANASSSSSCRPAEATTTSRVVALRVEPVEGTLRVRFAADPQVLSQMRRMLRRWLQALRRAEPTRSLPSRWPAARRAPTRSSMPMLPAWPTSSSRRGTRTGS